MRLLISKHAIWVYSLILFLLLGLILDISTISAEEYAAFDPHSTLAVDKAELLRTIHSFYFPVILVGHFVALIIIIPRKIEKV